MLNDVEDSGYSRGPLGLRIKDLLGFVISYHGYISTFHLIAPMLKSEHNFEEPSSLRQAT